MNWWSNGPRATLDLPLRGRWSLEAHADVLAALWRPTVVVGDDQNRRAAPVSAAVGLVVKGRLW
jgi:hypothetical protein